MSTFVFIPMPAYGHVNPTLAVAGKLVADGHRVIYYIDETFRAAVEATGAEVRGYSTGLAEQSWQPQTGSAPPVERLMTRMLDTAEQVADDLQHFLSTVDPDLIVYESMCLWGKFAVMDSGARSALIYPSYAMAPGSSAARLMRQMAEKLGRPVVDPERLRAVAAKYGVSIDNTMEFFFHQAPTNLVFMPKEFHPDSDQLGERFHFVGPTFAGRQEVADFPVRDGTLLISLGTVFNQQAEFFRTAMKAFADSGPVVLSYGSRLSDADFPDVPANFTIASHVPQLRVLEHSRVFVTHGGMNSTMEGIANGVPLVVVPQMVEQEMTAKRVAELGLGIHLPPEEATADRLADAVATVDTPEYRERVAKMREAALGSGGADKAAAILTKVAG
ncbi:macrolide family glycosyltransferase [Fodinicola acaciae]|uniref:macrolide family glycosyltransferase n=1 Tax=Fodinicola acaciae TaxID=2681555 RepID=UPI0013CF4B6C|nr:macrolide family glycosyltransferase [Fodinicola acaciae]